MSTISDLRTLRINQSMTRPILILGCDRMLLLLSGLICMWVLFNIGFAKLSIMGFIIPIVGWFASQAGLKAMAKHDPLMRDVMQRAQGYNKGFMKAQYFFPAKGNLGVRQPSFVKNPDWKSKSF